MPAQDIPVLPKDPAVLNGVLPNGMSYYAVGNPSDKGVADFALVQKTGLLTSEDREKVKSAADNALRELKRISGPSVKVFLTVHEVYPDNRGFVEVLDDATIFRFSNVRINKDSQVLDSTLLVIMDIADRINYTDDEFIKKWYSPEDQAIIVSGDIDVKSVAAKLQYMSYMTPAGKSMPRPEYAREEEHHIMEVSENDGFVRISAKWTSRRLPREYMNTIQSEIFEMSLNTLGEVAVARIKACLRGKGIPVADVSYSHICSSEYPYDDSFAVHVAVERENAEKAQEILASVMSSIGGDGAGTKEYAAAESVYIQKLIKEASMPVKSNEEYVERCKNSFLYNSSLSSSKERLAFQTSRNLPDTMRQRLFNNIASALIDTVGLTFPETKGEYDDLCLADTLLVPAAPLKMKIKSIRKEPVSGGSIWTFSNGFKVIYKKMPSDRMYYSLALNGGYGSMAGVDAGEGAYMADYLKTCRVAGMRADDFMKCLMKEGISMDVAVGISKMSISGNAPEDEVPLLLRSLLAVANERAAGDEEEFRYYKDSEYLSLDYSRGGYYSRMTAIDSIMCPGYKYSPYKVKGRISPDFTKVAESYYNRQFGKTNDGVLVMVGNMPEERLKKLVSDAVGHFRTSEVVSRKLVLRYQPVSGFSTYTVEGNSDNVDVAVSARMPLTMDNYIAANLASMIMRRELARKLNESGMYFTLTYNCRIYPDERFNAVISIPSATLADLISVRPSISGLGSVEMTEDDLKPYKEALRNEISLEMQSPEYWIDAITLRYIDGKDLSSNYSSRIDAMTMSKVKEILGLLDDGGKIEYVTIKK